MGILEDYKKKLEVISAIKDSQIKKKGARQNLYYFSSGKGEKRFRVLLRNTK